MAYEYGVATSAADLLDKIRVVALARGWTVDEDSNPSATSRRLSLHVGDAYFHLVTESSNPNANPSNVGPWIFGHMSTGYSAGPAYDAQPGTSRLAGTSGPNSRCQCNQLIGPFTSYRIFSGATFIHVVVETVPNVFSHIAIGVLNKYGSYTGGGYMSMSSWYSQGASSINFPETPSHCYLFDTYQGQNNSERQNTTIVRVDVDGRTWSYNTTLTTAKVTGIIRNNTAGFDINEPNLPNMVGMKRTPNVFNLVSPLLPSTLYVSRGSSLYSPIGEVPNLRVVNMEYLNAGDILTIGADEWVIIPAKSNAAPINVTGSTVPSSANYGYAYKKEL